MLRLLSRATLLSLPFVLLAILVAIVDPFDCLGLSSVVAEQVKFVVAQPLHNPLWKVQKFRSAPQSRLILGDSSMASLNAADIRAASGQDYFNFAYGGGTLAEAIDTYWLAARSVHLEAVYIGIGLINFNEYQNLNRVPEALAIVSSPLRYLTNRLVVAAAFLSAYGALSPHTLDLTTPSIDRQAFWRFQLDEAAPQLLHEYRFPRTSAARLQALAADCRRHGTRLVIVIPPTSIELQRRFVELGREQDEARFKSFVRTLGTVYDFDIPNEFTRERTNFIDPFHTVDDHMVIGEVWGNRPHYAQYSTVPASR
ncbi:MAG TPA: hypothetical protein VMT29_12945 [Steroidobacteraceae bacterium]|nr:hypothetical protein [Steroidobacteraceae bacterium]